MKVAFEIEPEKAHLIYRALRREDGHSLASDWTIEEQRELTAALDVLRAALPQEAK